MKLLTKHSQQVVKSLKID